MLHDCIWSSDSRRQLNAFVSQQLDKIAKPSVFATNAFMTRIQRGDRRKKLKQKGKKREIRILLMNRQTADAVRNLRAC